MGNNSVGNKYGIPTEGYQPDPPPDGAEEPVRPPPPPSGGSNVKPPGTPDTSLLSLGRMVVSAFVRTSGETPTMYEIVALRRLDDLSHGLDAIYPRDVFQETCRDSGVRFIWALRQAIDERRAELVGP